MPFEYKVVYWTSVACDTSLIANWERSNTTCRGQIGVTTLDTPGVTAFLKKLRDAQRAADEEIQRLLNDGWKLEGGPVKRSSDYVGTIPGRPEDVYRSISYIPDRPVIGDVYGQALTREVHPAIIPPVPPTFIVPPVPTTPISEPATLVPPAVNWNRLEARSRANLQTGIPNVLPTNVSGGARKTTRRNKRILKTL